MEEKGSDVNLAVHLLNDAWKKSFDAAVTPEGLGALHLGWYHPYRYTGCA